ncbi:MAG: protein phosphatase 2C domain-containing protein [Candidatus Sungbacteria bacterium]|nr:protein phosphatase 2C domain-containing protein [Candidatus Sungbacteria bacterium]
MQDLFEVAAGSVVGRDHAGRGNLLTGRNNQDAYFFGGKDVLVGLVCDGCSQGPHSEVGANIGAYLIGCILESSIATSLLQVQISRSKKDAVDEYFKWVHSRAMAQIDVVAKNMFSTQGQKTFSEVVGDYFLFTTVGFLVTPEVTVIFSVGDGVYCVNGEISRIGPYPNNQPPYLAYGLLSTRMDPQLLQFACHAVMPTSEVQSILVGTDGVDDLIAAEQKCIPGKSEFVGPLSQFWLEDRFFRPDQIRRRLALLNSEVTCVDSQGTLIRQPGLLRDDTTLVVVRRKPFSAGKQV